MATINLNDAAGRTAYLAGFHAAQALISEKTGRAVKTHRGVGAEFHRIIKGDARVDNELRAFLGFAYNLKAIADYETGPDAGVSSELATAVIQSSKRFVAKVSELLKDSKYFGTTGSPRWLSLWRFDPKVFAHLPGSIVENVGLRVILISLFSKSRCVSITMLRTLERVVFRHGPATKGRHLRKL